MHQREESKACAWRLLFQTFSQESKSILNAMSWVTVFLLAAKLIAAGKEVLVAHRYGTGALVDGFLFTFNLASWPVSVLYSVMSFVFIPLLMRLRFQAPMEVRRFEAEMLGVCSIIAIVLSLVAYLILPAVIGSAWTGLSTEVRAAAMASVPWCTALIGLGLISSVYSIWLMSEGRHANTFLEAMPSLGIAVGLLFWPGDQAAPNLTPMLLGMVGGSMVQLGLLSAIHGEGVRPAFRPRSSCWQEMGCSFGVMLLAQVVLTSTALLDQFLLARLPEGSLASFSYAQRVMALMLGLSATVLGRAMLPVVAAMSDVGASWRMVKRWSLASLLGGALGAIFLAVGARTIVSLLFEHGAFAQDSTDLVAKVLWVLSLQWPFYLLVTILVQWFSSQRKHGLFFQAVMAGVGGKILFVVFFDRSNILIIAASIAVMYVVMAAMLLMMGASIPKRE